MRTQVGERLRALYAVPEERYRELALAGMLATGSDDFKDVIVPLLSGANPQDRLGTYRTWDEFHLSCLGANWAETVRQWNEPARVGFVSELIRRRFAPDIAAFVHSDPSLSVKLAAINTFGWVEPTKNLPTCSLRLTMLRSATISARSISTSYRRPAIPGPRPCFATCSAHRRNPKRGSGRSCLILSRGHRPCPEIKEALPKLPSQLNEHQQHLVRNSLALLGSNDKDWVSAWIAERIANGSFWGATMDRLHHIYS